MYQKYFNLKENPFNITADPEYFFSSNKHTEAFSHLEYGIQQRKGIILITGEIGTGKTTVIRTLLNRLDKETKTAFILHPNFSDTQLMKMILKDLDVPTSARNRYEMIDALNDFLLEETSSGNNVVLIIDEAQNLKPKQMEQIRLLSNLETEKEKLLQIILVGQPELIDLLNLPSLRQVNQRVAVRYHILALELEELKEYIHHRLNIACNSITSKAKFTENAITEIYQHSNGTPRMANILCDRALLFAFANETNIIDEKIIRQCAREIGQK